AREHPAPRCARRAARPRAHVDARRARRRRALVSRARRLPEPQSQCGAHRAGREMRLPTIAAGLGALLLGACSLLAPRDRSRFYVLTPLAVTDPTSSATPPGRRMALGLGPVNVPSYLDRPEIVTRVNPNEL